ncbi:Tll0287-like domain-containing protein [Arcobacter sp. FWKO B]|uniref:Tll0287-like domain-containing protein n=1 Tax=Arcobacter sp. FWKO B TaxID=2593672 RepID=UPI0018A60014|nr:DUF3365 domain-containing protein [Arcobacter sp. FWKO B]QOG12380.1 DUF3365 domain-containing protein [Arcobacter sp. FWKO B]
MARGILIIISLALTLFATTLNYNEKALQGIQKLGSTLKGELQNMLKNDPSGLKALYYCEFNAQNITNTVNESLHQTYVKRTSLKIRNPLNTPTAQDIDVMNEFKKLIEIDSVNPDTLSKVIDTNEKYYLYKPLVIESACLKCHGDIAFIDKDILKVINEKYPQDKAVDYKLGDFRGVIVSVINKD